MIVKRKRSGGNAKLLESLQTEITILQRCGSHENVLQLFDAFDTPRRVLLVMELATGGDLLGWATDVHRPFSERHAASATVQILGAIAFLHAQGIVHRDIKPDNVLVRDRGSFVIKVADFGCSKILPIAKRGGAPNGDSDLGKPIINDDASEHEALMETFVGTKVYAAPEILRHEPYDATVDEYSTGILLALLLTGTHPLSDVEMDTNLALASSNAQRGTSFFRTQERGVANFWLLFHRRCGASHRFSLRQLAFGRARRGRGGQGSREHRPCAPADSRRRPREFQVACRF